MTAIGDDRRCSRSSGDGSIGRAIIAFVRDHGAGLDLGAGCDQSRHDRGVVRGAAGNLKGQRAPLFVGLQMDFG